MAFLAHLTGQQAAVPNELQQAPEAVVEVQQANLMQGQPVNHLTQGEDHDIDPEQQVEPEGQGVVKQEREQVAEVIDVTLPDYIDEAGLRNYGPTYQREFRRWSKYREGEGLGPFIPLEEPNRYQRLLDYKQVLQESSTRGIYLSSGSQTS